MCDLLDFEEQVRCSLGSYRILSAPLLPYAGDGKFFAADWAEGLMQAIAVNPGPGRGRSIMAEQSLATVLLPATTITTTKMAASSTSTGWMS